MFEQLDEKMSIRIESELKDKVVALAHVWGFEGNYGNCIRHFLRVQLPKVEELMPEEMKKQYTQTFENLSIIRQNKIDKVLGIQKEEKENGTGKPSN